MPSFITVRLNGVTNGTECDLCSILNRDYSLELVSSHPWYCDWVCDLDDFAPGVSIFVYARIGYAGPLDDYYFIEVSLVATIEDCVNDHQHIYWYHEQPTPYDCSNLNVLAAFERDESPGGCTSGTARVLS